MDFSVFRKTITAAGVFLAAWLGVKYLLPVLLPFVLGMVIAVTAEPAVGFCIKKTKLPRGVAAGIGVSVTLVLLLGVLSLAGALAVKELGQLAHLLPDVQQTVDQGLLLLQDTLVSAADRLPDGVRTVATGVVLDLCGGGNEWIAQTGKRMPELVSTLLGRIPDGALGVGTGVLAGFMISARLPNLRQKLRSRLPRSWYEQYLPALHRVKRSLGGWLKAQGKLALVTYALLLVGFLLLGVPYGFLWAVPVALVDAIPVLGTGVVLVPWALICFLQGRSVQAVGLLALCTAAAVVRRVLEPKLVGKQLGLDPLVTLVFLYIGYRFWGIAGMILAPLLAAAAKSLAEAGAEETG